MEFYGTDFPAPQTEKGHSIRSRLMLSPCNSELNQENLTLIYGGSYSRPHYGHIDVILSGLDPIWRQFLSGFYQVNISIWAISWLKVTGNSFSTWNAEQISWTPFLNPKQRVWVWPSTWYLFKPCIDVLVRLTAADGFHVVFSHLIGPGSGIQSDPIHI